MKITQKKKTRKIWKKKFCRIQYFCVHFIIFVHFWIDFFLYIFQFFHAILMILCVFLTRVPLFMLEIQTSQKLKFKSFMEKYLGILFEFLLEINIKYFCLEFFKIKLLTENIFFKFLFSFTEINKKLKILFRNKTGEYLNFVSDNNNNNNKNLWNWLWL